MQPSPALSVPHRHWRTVRPHSTDLEVSPQGHLVTYGVSDRTAGSTQLAVNIVTMPPGAVALGHIHHDHESIIYVISGHAVTFLGAEASVEHSGPGDFLFIPAGVEHLPANLSPDEPVLALVCRADPKFYESLELIPRLDELAAGLLPELRQVAS